MLEIKGERERQPGQPTLVELEVHSGTQKEFILDVAACLDSFLSGVDSTKRTGKVSLLGCSRKTTPKARILHQYMNIDTVNSV